jgi:uncharacterized protein YdeI (YjbR/CyaY-like superfamily)
MEITKTLTLANRDDWRLWLKRHHRTEKEIWLVYYKKHTRRPTIPYDDAVEEALCFGWIDSIVKRIDEDCYAQKFTPRKDIGNWSESNRRRIKKLIKEGKMTEAGMAKIGAAVLSDEPRRAQDVTEAPQFFVRAIKANKMAWKNFNNLAPSYRNAYVRWVTSAKKEETRARRLKEAVELLASNKKPGMK